MLKCTKINFGWGSAPDPAGGAYSAPPDPLAGFKGPTSKGRGREGGEEGKGEGRDLEVPPQVNFLDPPMPVTPLNMALVQIQLTTTNPFYYDNYVTYLTYTL